jgi:beta-mannosidase
MSGKRIGLTDSWTFMGCDAQEAAADQLVKPDLAQNGWLDISVPGDVNVALFEHGKIPDFKYDTKARECFWITSKDWWFKKEFDFSEAAGKSSYLFLTEVDGHADIWLNGSYLGEMKNAFREFKFNVTDVLKAKGNLLLLRFKSIDKIMGSPRVDEQLGWKDKRSLMRKPSYSFGWDWAVSLPSIGLAGDVRIEYDNEFYFKEYSVQPFLDGRIDFAFDVSTKTKEAGYSIRVKVSGHGASVKKEIKRNCHRSYLDLRIKNPKLWCPAGYGEPNLYNYTIDLIVNGKIVESISKRVGFRTSRTLEKPFTPEAGPGYSFELVINDEPMLIKGTNWVPLELSPGMTRREQYEFYLKRAKEANFNMVRIWGGGFYEKEIFYDLCDEYGLLVWQDYMFGGGAWYSVDLLRDELILEANYQLRRLRNRTCIVIWCGCNEDIYSWVYQGETSKDKQKDELFTADKKEEIQTTRNRLRDDPIINTMILRGLTNKYSLDIPYVESSPMSRDDVGNQMNSGNCHISCLKYALFETDKPQEFRRHFERVCSFDSEFASLGPCSERLFKKFLAPENLWPPNDAWNFHVQKSWSMVPMHDYTLRITEPLFGKIDSLKKFVKFGQTMHLEYARTEYEGARTARPNNGGTMNWMFNDTWPTANWAIIDYERTLKPVFYATKRACAPVLPIIFERFGIIEFFLSNETSKDAKVALTYGQESLAGEKVWSKKTAFKSCQNSARKFASVLRKKARTSSGDYFYIDAVINNRKHDRVIFFPNLWKDVAWPEPTIECKIIGQKAVKGAWITKALLKTDKFVRLCHIVLKKADTGAMLSDNYFDMHANSSREITIESKYKLTVDDLGIKHWLTDWE